MAEGTVAILVGLIALGLLVVPIMALVGLVRSSRLDRESRELKQRLHTLELQLDALGRRVASAKLQGDDADQPTPGAVPVPEGSEAAAAAPPEGLVPAGPTAKAPSAHPAHAEPGREALVAPPPTTPEPPPVERESQDDAAPEPTPPTTEPASAEPPVPSAVAAGAVSSTARVTPAARRSSGTGGRQGAPPSASSAAPSFDWENLLGLKGAAWLGGITLVVAAMFLAKMAYDAGVFTPPLRVAAMVAAGVGALVWAELNLRRGYQTTANAVSGAGIAILYVAFFAARTLYDLFPAGLTLVLMTLVTLVAALLAVRYDAYYTAVLGLLGGFATPVVISTGADRPVSLFSYILLLNVGLLSVALRKRWHGLVQLALAGTFVIELGWFGSRMTPEKTLIGLVAFLLFGILYLVLPALAQREGEEESQGLLRTGAIGGIVPFLFAVLIAGNRRYSAEWGLLFTYVALLDAALVAVALLRGRVALLLAAAVATALTLPLWAAQGLSSEALWGPTLAAIAIVALLNAVPRLAVRFGPDALERHPALLEAVGLVAVAGLGLVALMLAPRDLASPPWAFVTLVAALTALLVERSRAGRIRGALAVVATAIAILIGIWFFSHATPETLVRDLALPLLFIVAMSLVASQRVVQRGFDFEDEAAVLLADAVVLAILFGCLASARLGSDPLPLFAALALVSVVAVASALRGASTAMLPVTLLGAGLFSLTWHELYFAATDASQMLAIHGLFYLAFLALPFVLPAPQRERWRDRAAPWWTSALAGPVYFLSLRGTAVEGWGSAWIGVLPLVQAALTVVALHRVSEFFRPARDATPAGKRRLDQLALFSAISLGFVAIAIPLQLDRQWITLGWALQAAAVWWLYGHLPHRGLRLFGAMLYLLVGARLLLNPEVLRYQPRGWAILNWLLYTYGVAAICCFVGAWLLRRAESRRPEGERTKLAPAAAFLGLLLVFWLINLEVADYYSPGRYIEFDATRSLARDLTMSVAWAVYAMVLLGLGIARGLRPLRLVSLGFLVLTVAKVFLHDLSNLTGVYRVLSFLGLGVSLIAVSLIYQRFVVAREEKR